MPIFTSGVNAPATGLHLLSIIARLHGRSVDSGAMERVVHASDANDPDTVRRVAQQSGFRVKAGTAHGWPELLRLPMPFMCRSASRGWMVVARTIGKDALLVYGANSDGPTQLTAPDLADGYPVDVLLFKACDSEEARIGFGFAWFLQALRPYRRILGEVLIASLVVQLFALAAPIFFQVVIDKVLAHQGRSTLDVLACGMLMVILFEATLGGIRNYLAAHTSSRIDATLGADVFARLLNLPTGYFLARRVGDTVARVRELEVIRRFMMGPALLAAIDFAFSGIFVALLFHYSASLTLAVLLIVPAFLLLAAAITPPMRRRLEQQFKTGAQNQAQLIESVSEVTTIKSLAAETALQGEWERRLAGHVRAVFKAANIASVAAQGAAMLQRLTMLVTLWLGARMVMSGALTVGQLVAFSMIVGRLMMPMQRLIQLWQEFQQVRVSVGRLAELLNTPGEPKMETPRARNLTGRVELRHIHFRHRPDDDWVLNDVCLGIEPGEVVGIVGPSGSGKSTVARLLQGLHAPEQGKILVDGIDARQFNLAWLRRRIAVIAQDAVLFNRSVRENVTLAFPEADDSRVWNALDLAGAADFVRRLPGGMETVLGEGGSTLSGGERQRLAIARALITEPDVLVFDEATSAVDFEAERRLQANMARIAEGRTVVVIAHRLSALRSVDRIVTLREGHVQEDGTPADLIRAGGYFSEMVRTQAELMGFRLYREAS